VSAAKKLVTYVHVDGQVYGPNDDVPADVAKQITNPKAWGGEVPEDSVEARTAASVDPSNPALTSPPSSGNSGGAAPAAKKTAAKKTAKKSAAKKSAS
jgi:hypothetical protein